MAKRVIPMELSPKSMRDTIKKLQEIRNRTEENMRLATADLMEATYDMLKQLMEENNLQNHVSSLNKELSSDKLGFRIYTDDMIIVFHEYGTGIYNSESPTNEPWTYYNEKYTNEKGTHFFTTSGMPAKYIFHDVEEFLAMHAKDYYSVALQDAVISDKQYQSFKSSLR